jgi:hypothetical protein
MQIKRPTREQSENGCGGRGGGDGMSLWNHREESEEYWEMGNKKKS